ncbi:unnamed protein product [Rhizophagus irregularis]|nr:unnamed protein product [Rhizophagus irregularis]
MENDNRQSNNDDELPNKMRNMSVDNSIDEKNYDETSDLNIDTKKNSTIEAIGIVISVVQTFDEFAPLIDLKTKIKFALDICRGVAYLHECEILHRDIQSANVLVDGNHKVKIANFAVENDENNNNDAQKKKVPYDSKCEIYSVGALLWEIAELKKPHYDLDKSVLLVNIRKRVSERYCLPFSNDVPTEWRTIVTRAMEYDSMWRIKTADKGNPSAQLRYGMCLWEGNGVGINTPEALKYLKMAANQENSAAMYIIGKAYWKGGNGIEKDKKQGAEYLKKAASNNHPKAKEMCNELGIN